MRLKKGDPCYKEWALTSQIKQLKSEQIHIVKVSPQVTPHASYGGGSISTDQQLPPSTSTGHNSLTAGGAATTQWALRTKRHPEESGMAEGGRWWMRDKPRDGGREVRVKEKTGNNIFKGTSCRGFGCWYRRDRNKEECKNTPACQSVIGLMSRVV